MARPAPPKIQEKIMTIRTQIGNARAALRVFLSIHKPGTLNNQCELGLELRKLSAQISWNKAKIGVTKSKSASGPDQNLNNVMKTDNVKNQLNNLTESFIWEFSSPRLHSFKSQVSAATSLITPAEKGVQQLHLPFDPTCATRAAITFSPAEFMSASAGRAEHSRCFCKIFSNHFPLK